jgi:hypothetical protein
MCEFFITAASLKLAGLFPNGPPGCLPNIESPLSSNLKN